MSRRTRAERRAQQRSKAAMTVDQLAQLRESNGRLSRAPAAVAARTAVFEAEAKQVALDARSRHVGLPAALLDLSDAGRANAGTVHGIMRLRNELTADQFAAAEWYIGTRLAWRRAIGLDAADGPPSLESDAFADPDEWRKAVKATWDRVRNLLQAVSIRLRRAVIAAFETILVNQQHMPHMIEELKAGLDAVSAEFLVGRKPAGSRA